MQGANERGVRPALKAHLFEKEGNFEQKLSETVLVPRGRRMCQLLQTGFAETERKPSDDDGADGNVPLWFEGGLEPATALSGGSPRKCRSCCWPRSRLSSSSCSRCSLRIQMEQWLPVVSSSAIKNSESARHEPAQLPLSAPASWPRASPTWPTSSRLLRLYPR